MGALGTRDPADPADLEHPHVTVDGAELTWRSTI
jgi:hypothetical protein